MKEGDPGTFMFLIDEGSVSIFKDELKLTKRVAGDLVGLMSLIDQDPRSATVIASEDGVKGYIIDKDGLSEIMSEEQNSIVSTMLFNYLRYQQDAIRNTNALSLAEVRTSTEQEQKRIRSARFFIQMLTGLLILMFAAVCLNEEWEGAYIMQIGISFIAILGIWSFVYMRFSGFPPETFGLGKTHFPLALQHVLKSTMVFIIFLFLAKFILISVFPDRFGTQLIEWYQPGGAVIGSTWIALLVYCLYVIVQEFAARACIQQGLLRLVVGRHAKWTAILVTALIFCSFYMAMDINYAILFIVPNVLWGYLFDKNKNIMSVIISHILIGITAIFILNLVG